MKYITRIVTLFAVLGTANVSIAQDFISHDFNDGGFGAYKECTTQNPNYARVEHGRVKTFWTEDGYNGSRMKKGAEICSKNDWSTRKEGWYGLTMSLGSDYPNNKRAGVAQIFQFVSSSLWTWAAMLIIDDGDLSILHRDNSGTSRNSEETIYRNVPKNKDLDIVMHFILSNENKGELQVWIDGVSQYHKKNINFGFGSWKNDVQTGQYTYVDLKAGQYNFGDGNYSNGETRTVYYDNIAWFNGSNGYSKVDPSNGSGGAPDGNTDPSGENTYPSVQFSKPSANQVFSQGEDPVVNVLASDDGDISNIKLYLDGAFLRQESKAPYDWNHTSSLDPELKNLPVGRYTLTAVAEDNTGLTTEKNISFSIAYEDQSDCDLPWSDSDFSVTYDSKTYFSGPINISCVNSATLSMDIEGVGPMETTDYLDVYYQIDGNGWSIFSENVDSFSKKTVTAKNLSGGTVEIAVDVRNSYYNETYSVSNMKLFPSGSTDSPTEPPAETPDETPSDTSNGIVVMQKQNTDFAIDGNRGANEGQQLYLWDTDTNNVNQQWQETALANGYYTYRKVDTSLCIDGGSGAARRQPVTLENCTSRNQDQHWKKVNLSNGSFRLEKRGTSYSIDGNRNGDQRQAIYLWNSSNSNINQQWQFHTAN